MRQLVRPLFFVISVVILFNSCKKDPLPDLTQAGLNTFGVRIDGKPWLPTGTSGPMGTEPTYAALREDGAFRISANSTQYLLVINVPGVARKKTGEYELGFTEDNFGYFNDEKDTYLTDKDHIGSVRILKLDSAHQIISGTFHFRAKDMKSANVKEFTEGRFDVIYKCTDCPIK